MAADLRRLLPARASVFPLDVGKGLLTRESGILVDTNVWFFLVKPTRNKPHQDSYVDFVSAAAKAHIPLWHVSAILIEIAAAIEGSAFRVWASDNRIDPDGRARKQHRQQPGERAKVAEQVYAAVSEIRNLSELLDVGVSVDSALDLFACSTLDPTDAIIARSALDKRMPILTDDGDYASVDGLTMFTANPAALRSVRQ